MNQKNTNKPKLSNNIKNIANKGSSALQQVKDKVIETANSLKKTTNKVVENVKGKVDNVTKKITNKAEESESITKLSSMTQEFFNSNSAISKFVGFFLCLLLFIILFQIGMGLLLKMFGPSYNPYVINGMVSANREMIVNTNPNIKDSVPLYRSIDQPQGIEFTWNVWFVINNNTKMTDSDSYTIFSKGKAPVNKSYSSANNSASRANSIVTVNAVNLAKSKSNYETALTNAGLPINTLVDAAITNTADKKKLYDDSILLISTKTTAEKATIKSNYDKAKAASDAGTLYKTTQTTYNTAVTAATAANAAASSTLNSSVTQDKYLNVSPGVFIKKNIDSYDLEVVLNTFDISSNKIPYEKIVINNIPIQKWVCSTIRVQGAAVDVYINGMLKKRVNLNNIPKQNYYDVYIGQNSGMNGYISSLRYYNYAVGYDEIQSLFRAGPSLKMISNDDMPAGLNDYLSVNWYFDNAPYLATATSSGTTTGIATGTTRP